MEVNGAPDLLCFPHSSEYLPLCSAEQRHSYRFGTTWDVSKWQNFHFWVIYPFKVALHTKVYDMLECKKIKIIKTFHHFDSFIKFKVFSKSILVFFKGKHHYYCYSFLRIELESFFSCNFSACCRHNWYLKWFRHTLSHRLSHRYKLKEGPDSEQYF